MGVRTHIWKFLFLFCSYINWCSKCSNIDTRTAVNAWIAHWSGCTSTLQYNMTVTTSDSVVLYKHFTAYAARKLVFTTLSVERCGFFKILILTIYHNSLNLTSGKSTCVIVIIYISDLFLRLFLHQEFAKFFVWFIVTVVLTLICQLLVSFFVIDIFKFLLLNSFFSLRLVINLYTLLSLFDDS